MKTRLPAIIATAIVVALAVALMVLPWNCHDDISRSRGVFYQRTTSERIPLLQGTAVEMTPRAISVGSTVRPSFLINLPTHKPSDVRIGINLVDGKGGPFQRVDVTAVAVEGTPGLFTVRPNTDLPHGLCAIVVGFDDRLLDDRNNVYPFRIVEENAAP